VSDTRAAVVALAFVAAAVCIAPRSVAAGQGRCSAAETSRTVRSLVVAFDAGDVASVNALVATGPAFKWFSAPGPDARLGQAAYDRATLGAYVRKRHRHHERLTIRRIGTTNRADGNFALVLERRADDYSRRVIDGKGAVSCAGAAPKVIVWSLGSRIAK
jgi:hypothetical protein